jgi:hypothetical protein
MTMQAALAAVASVALATPANAATTTGTLAVSETVAYPCSIFVAPGPAGSVCQPTSNPTMAAAPHAIRSLRFNAETAKMTITIEF